MTKNSATSQAIEINLRRNRARQLAAEIFRELEHVLTDTEKAAVRNILVEVLHRNGACIETDALRADLGKEPRDNFGWTPSERLRQQDEKREILMLWQKNYSRDGKLPDR